MKARSGEEGTGRWLRAVALAFGVHGAVGVGAFAAGAGDDRGLPSTRQGAALLLGGAEGAPLEGTVVDLLTIETVEAWSVANPPARDQSDRAVEGVGTGALAAGQPAPERALAPDVGQGAGRVLAPAWRRDLSTLRARVSDGARVYQPSREKRAQAATSPQDARREPTTGVGDSARTATPRPSLPLLEKPDPAAGDTEGKALPQAVVGLALEGRDEHRAQGPLDTPPGPKSFDTVFEGSARDQQKLRAASDEPRPIGAEFTAAASPGPTDTAGKGVGTRPGATPHPSGGVSATRPGAGGVTGTDATADTIERKYAREYQEIRLRVGRSIVFPKQPALLLLQGEAIVLFRVSTAGRIEGTVRLLKSAGHDDYDREAVDAVQRAAPFPNLPEAQWVRLRIPFLPAAMR